MTGRIIRTNPNDSKLPRIGFIKIGEKVKPADPNKKEYPVSLDYFIAKGKYEKMFEEAYPDKPNKIQIIFASDNFKEVCFERYELRTKSGHLYGDGDGEVFRIWSDKTKDYKEYLLSEHPELLTGSAQKAESIKGWEKILTLRFIIPAIRGVFGQWQLSTKGEKSSIDSILAAFDFVYERASTVQRIPFDLTVEKVKSQKPNDPRLYPVLNLIPNISDKNLILVSKFIESGQNLKELPMFTDNFIETKLQLAETTEHEVIEEPKLPWDKPAEE